jgi:hypothetical protein
MKRLGRVACGVLAASLLLGGAAVLDIAFSTPPPDLRPLPSELVAAGSSEGEQLLAASRFTADYNSLTQAFEAQSRRAYCGVASSVIVLNALRNAHPHLTQSTFFSAAASRVRSPLRVTLQGMTLEQLADLLRANDADVTLFHASDANVDTFRSIVRENLQTPGDFVVVNYERALLGQGETGHISPLAAYNAQADRLLVLDVAAYKYPPAWVPTQTLWNAMNTVDSDSGRSRGFVVVRDKGGSHEVPGT